MERASETLVLDASVLTKWFVEEEGADLANRLRDLHIAGAIRAMAPDLVLYELANALRYHPRAEDTDIEKDLSDFFELQLDLIIPSSGLLEAAHSLSTEHNTSVYDACYAALGLLEACDVVTADGNLRKALGAAVQVRLLSEMGTSWEAPA